MQVQVPTMTAVCEVAVRHDRCRGQVYSLLGDQPCGCPCHQPDPIEEEELEALLELEAERALEATLEAEHVREVA